MDDLQKSLEVGEALFLEPGDGRGVNASSERGGMVRLPSRSIGVAFN